LSQIAHLAKHHFAMKAGLEVERLILEIRRP